MSRGKWLIVVSLVLLLLGLLIIGACSSEKEDVGKEKPAETAAPATPEASDHSKVQIRHLGSPFGGTAYPIIFGYADVVNTTHPWLSVKVVETTGSHENLAICQKNPSANKLTIFGFIDTDFWKARNSIAPYEEKMADLVYLANYGVGAIGLITLNPDIKTLDDLVGKRIGLGPKGYGGTSATELYLESAGILDKISIEYLGSTEANEALADGLVDAAYAFCVKLGSSMSPAPFNQSVMAGRTVYAVDITASVEKVPEVVGYPAKVMPIPGGVFTQEETVGWLSANLGTLCTWKDVNEEIIYEYLKTIGEAGENGVLAQYSKAGKFLTPQLWAEWAPVQNEDEVHPGALKYYKEKGLQIGIIANR